MEKLLFKIVLLNVVLLSIYCDPIRTDNDVDDDNGYDNGHKSNQQAADKPITINQTTSGNKIQKDNNGNNNHNDSNGANIRRQMFTKDYQSSKLLPECILKTADFYLWWLNEDGTLNFDQTSQSSGWVDLSNEARTEVSILTFLLELLFGNQKIHYSSGETQSVEVMSLARCGLNKPPEGSLSLINSSIRYLTMAGNDFDHFSLPSMPNLVELDLRLCGLDHLNADIFKEFIKLEKLFLSHNKIKRLSANAFGVLKKLIHLDIAYNNMANNRYDPYKSLTEVLELDENIFVNLTSLKFLDMSHTKITQVSARAFLNLSATLEQMSICYTDIAIIGNGIFGRNNLTVIDLSGNKGIVTYMKPGSHVDSGVEILAYENAGAKNLSWIGNLGRLKVLLLQENNINKLQKEVFRNLPYLQILDMGFNHISNWYSRIFQNNKMLRVLDLADNNINVLTSEMIKDIGDVDYLSLGGNNFVCHCLLKDFIDVVSENVNQFNCPQISEPKFIDSNTHLYDVFNRILYLYTKAAKNSSENIQNSLMVHGTQRILKYREPKFPFVDSATQKPLPPFLCNGQELIKPSKRNSTSNSLKLENITTILADYSDNRYKCMDSETNSENIWINLNTCAFEKMNDSMTTEIPKDTDPILNSSKASMIALLTVFLVFGLAIFIIYYTKWSYLKYFCIIVRNATVLSLMKHDKEQLLRKQSVTSTITTFLYDVFVSYSDQNREWVLNELLPNIEKTDEINVCLHERDFQIGVSILENIIYCMDHSRTILLVLSENFIMSHWCQFEMHLAQHRLLETRREQLILVLLEDISRHKRPKTLSYLMKTKTYISWPNYSNKITSATQLLDERKVFWKRLKKAIKEYDCDWERSDTDINDQIITV